MKQIQRIILIGLITLLSLVVINAQDAHPEVEFIPQGENNPYKNEIANACYYGGTLSGKCNTTDVNGDKIVDDYDRDWMWTAGWHLIRYEYGMEESDTFERSYAPILPEKAVRPINAMASGCYEIIYQGVPQRYILWNGGASVQTVKLYFRPTCEGAFFFLENIVAVETIEEADLLCKRDRGKYLYAERFASSFYHCAYYEPNFSTYTTDYYGGE